LSYGRKDNTVALKWCAWHGSNVHVSNYLSLRS